MENRSQLEELKLSERELWEKRVGHNRLNPTGIETPVGHVYSMILEELSRNGLDSTPEPKVFLQYLKNMIKKQDYFFAKNLDFSEGCFSSIVTNPTIEYMQFKGLGPRECAKVMKEVVGPNSYNDSRRNIERGFF